MYQRKKTSETELKLELLKKSHMADASDTDNNDNNFAISVFFFKLLIFLVERQATLSPA